MDETVGMGAQSQERVLFLRMAEILDNASTYVVADGDAAMKFIRREDWDEIAPEVAAVVARLKGE